jgi:hypothetical protein
MVHAGKSITNKTKHANVPLTAPIAAKMSLIIGTPTS